MSHRLLGIEYITCPGELGAPPAEAPLSKWHLSWGIAGESVSLSLGRQGHMLHYSHLYTSPACLALSAAELGHER